MKVSWMQGSQYLWHSYLGGVPWNDSPVDMEACLYLYSSYYASTGSGKPTRKFIETYLKKKEAQWFQQQGFPYNPE